MDRDPDLLAHFMRYFEILRADTPELLEEVFRLRYQVYCVEGAVSGFEPGDYPDGLERDVYDARSLHCLLRHRESGRYAGTLRLVCADAARVDAPFPLEVFSGRQMECEYLSIANPTPLPHRRVLAVHPRETVSLSPRRTAVGGRSRSSERR